MRTTAPVLFLAVALAACVHEEQQQNEKAPALPPLKLTERIEELKRLGAKPLPQLTAVQQKELQEYADVVLLLSEADERIQKRAERNLLESEHAGLVLVPALKHTDAGVRARAAWLLGRTGRAIHQFALLLRLKDETDGTVTVWLGEALHRLGNDAGLVWIDAAMNAEATAQVAGNAAIGLLREDGVQLSEQPTWQELQNELRTRTKAWRRTGIGSRDGVAPPDADHVLAILCKHLSITESFLLRPIDEAKFVISRSGVLALPTIAIALDAAEPYLRSVALQILAELGRTAKPLCLATLPLLGDPLTAAYAMRALGELGCSDAAPHLVYRLSSPDTELRASAAGALGILGQSDVTARLSAMMNDGTETMDVRVQAAFALRCLSEDAAAKAFFVERTQKGDYHAPLLQILEDRLAQNR